MKLGLTQKHTHSTLVIKLNYFADVNYVKETLACGFKLGSYL